MQKGIIFLFVLFFAVDVSAIQFSPIQLDFNVKTGEMSCQNISVVLESSTKISDVWAKNINFKWSVSGFDENAENLGIFITYPTEISKYEKQVKVCLSANEKGNYKGALVFEQEKIGNSVLKFAVWLKVNVDSDGENQIPVENNSNQNSSGNSGNGTDNTAGGEISGGNSGKGESRNNNQINSQINFLSLNGKPKSVELENVPTEKIKLSVRTEKNNPENSAFVLFIFVFSAVLFFVLIFLLMKVKTKRMNKLIFY